MAQWLFNRRGRATIIYDSNCFRNNGGHVVAWIYGDNVYSLKGRHVGWFEGGIFYDSHNNALGFLPNFTGYLPSIPAIGGSPGMPGFSGRPGRPGFSGIPGRPGYGGWSSYDLDSYFAP